MTYHISFRDVTFSELLDGIRIHATCDIPCHLWLRWTQHEPWIHTTPETRRGLIVMRNPRFCFTVYADVEQNEAGDSETHTFDIHDWPVCETRWFYLFGTVNLELSPSESAVFEYHRLAWPGPQPEDAMYQLNNLNPIRRTVPAAPGWQTIDLSYELPAAATGAICLLHNDDHLNEAIIGMRKPGANYDHVQEMARGSISSVVVGLDPSHRIETSALPGHRWELFIVGYTGRLVTFPDEPIDILPTVNNTYHTTNIRDTWPLAGIIFTDLICGASGFNWHSIRPVGSTKEMFNGFRRKWPFCFVPIAGSIETKYMNLDSEDAHWLAYAYVSYDYLGTLNGQDLGVFGAGSWDKKTLNGLGTPIRWGMVEIDHPNVTRDVGMRLNDGFLDMLGHSGSHAWLLSYLDQHAACQIYDEQGTMSARLVAGSR